VITYPEFVALIAITTA